MTTNTVESAGDSPLRLALLDAAYDEVVSGSWTRTRMADVARGAGVSRQTLYNEFGTKDALADALARRQTAAFLAGAAALLNATPADPDTDNDGTAGADPIEAIEAAIRWTLDRAHDDPMLKAILTSVHDGGEGSMLLPLLTTRGAPVLEAASAQIFAFLQLHWPDIDGAHLAQVASSMTRLIVSHVVLPTEPTEVTARVLAGFYRHLLTPAT